jgi:hypothetical protein
MTREELEDLQKAYNILTFVRSGLLEGHDRDVLARLIGPLGALITREEHAKGTL